MKLTKIDGGITLEFSFNGNNYKLSEDNFVGVDKALNEILLENTLLRQALLIIENPAKP